MTNNTEPIMVHLNDIDVLDAEAERVYPAPEGDCWQQQIRAEK